MANQVSAEEVEQGIAHLGMDAVGLGVDDFEQSLAVARDVRDRLADKGLSLVRSEGKAISGFRVVDANGQPVPTTTKDQVRLYLMDRPELLTRYGHGKLPSREMRPDDSVEGMPPPVVEQAVAAVLARLDALQNAARPESRADALRQHMAKVKKANTIDGLLVAEDEALRKVEQHARLKLAEQLQSDAATLRRDVGRLAAGIDQQIEASKALPPSRKTGADRGVELMERAEARSRYTGRPLAELAAFYQSTNDVIAPDLVLWLESEQQASFPTLKPRIDQDDDFQALRKLKQAIGARRDARVPAELQRARMALAEKVGGVVQRAFLAELAGE